MEKLNELAARRKSLAIALKNEEFGSSAYENNLRQQTELLDQMRQLADIEAPNTAYGIAYGSP